MSTEPQQNSSGKPLIVLIPGLGNNARLWTQQAEALSASHRIVIPDYAGAQTIDEMAARVLAQIPMHQFSLVGFSLGGYIALNLIASVPAKIERLAIISSSPYPDTEQATAQRESLIAKARQNYRAVLADMGRFIVSPTGEYAEHARQMLITMGEELGVDEFCRQQLAAMGRADSRQQLTAINCPVRVLCGEEDRVTPVKANRCLAENIRGAELQVIVGAGHLLPLEKPAEVTAFLQAWLQLGNA